MRVITGSAKGCRLNRVPGETTRPIMDRVKENLFNILGDISETVWLDLFAGTGQVGIEALSRGASHATFLDTAPAAIKTLQRNLTVTKLTTKSSILKQNAFQFIKESNGQFDIIFVAPPQYKQIWREMLQLIDEKNDRLATDGQLIIQIDPKEWEEIPLTHFLLVDKRKYGNTVLCFYEHSE